ncbi:MAG: SDR family oxidoreductase [Kofleriaceae bacterium]|nr:MAG: SDR family oxidoreductase [Kofleriaceae bacterium]MBZ0235343.1 SDR family oxidoreductase [Kofleriaceae bacterium]
MSTWLITGAGRGIGLEMARQLRARGDDVIGTVRDAGKAEGLRAIGARIEVCDVAEPAAIDALGERMRGQAIDVLVNNAGIGRFGGAVKDLTAEELHRYMAVNAIGPILVVRALLPCLRAGRQKKIASITSLMGSIADNGSGGAYGYRSSKAALNMLNASLALELRGDGFTCLVLNPGWVQTDMGGPRAPTPVDVSVRGLLAVIDGATPDVSGRFFDHDGKPLPW